jgi:hypothetical protein
MEDEPPPGWRWRTPEQEHYDGRWSGGDQDQDDRCSPRGGGLNTRDGRGDARWPVPGETNEDDSDSDRDSDNDTRRGQGCRS